MRSLAALLLAGSAVAHPWVPIGDDVRVIADPAVENDLRIELVRRARNTIEIANYDQRADRAVALPLATALRDAANRGVHIRFMVSWNTTSLFDYYNRFGELLVDPPTNVPIEYLIVGGPAAEDHGWRMLEGVHEKLLIVDDGALVTTGRGIGEEYLYWLDTAFAIRGPLVVEGKQVFDAVWNEARRHHRPYAGYLGGPSQASAPRYEAQARDLSAFVDWFRVPSPSKGARARILHHDFLRQIHALAPVPAEIGADERLARLSDPIVDAVVERLATAHEVRLSLLSTILHPKLKRALLDARSRGAEVTLFINTCAPRLDRSRKPIRARGSVWAMELPDLDELMAAGAKVYGFQIRADRPWLFLHRKLTVIDDTVFIGSHNLNLPSTLFFDEASFEIQSWPLADALAGIFDRDVLANGELLDGARVHRERKRLRERMLRWMSFPYLGYM